MKFYILCYIYWVASIVWFVDVCFEYAELHAEFFAPAVSDMLNDLYLGLSVVALGMILWLAILIIKGHKGVVKVSLAKK